MRAQTPDIDPIQEPPSFSEDTANIRGWPGYRTRMGRSGLDLIDTRAEWARMQGVFLSRLMRGRLRVRNPFHRVLIVLAGLVYFSPVVWTVVESLVGPLEPPAGIVVAVVYVTIGIGVLVVIADKPDSSR